MRIRRPFCRNAKLRQKCHESVRSGDALCAGDELEERPAPLLEPAKAQRGALPAYLGEQRLEVARAIGTEDDGLTVEESVFRRQIDAGDGKAPA